MDGLDVAVGLVQPGQDEKVVADGEVARGLANRLVEDDPGVGRSFAALHRRVLAPRERRLDAPDDAKRIGAGLGDRVILGGSQAPRRSANSEPSSRTPSSREIPR